MLVQRSKKRLLSEPQNKANKPNRTRDIICVGFFLWLGKTTTSPEKSHASCRLKVKQPSPDLAQLKSLYSCLSHLFRTGKSPRFPQNTVAKPAARTTDDPAAAKTQSGRRQALNCGQNRDLKLAQNQRLHAFSRPPEDHQRHHKFWRRSNHRDREVYRRRKELDTRAGGA